MLLGIYVDTESTRPKGLVVVAASDDVELEKKPFT